MLRSAALVLLLTLAAPATAARAQGPADDPSTPLVYVFVLDAFDRDWLEAGRAPFLSRLLAGQEGAATTNWRESRAVMVAETNPNHVAMATGAFADTSGIPGNAFAVYGDAAKKACGGDTTGPAPEAVDGETGTCAVAESFFTTAARDARITTAGVFGKPKLAQIFSTRRVAPDRYDADHLWSPCDPRDRNDFCDPSVAARPNDGYSVDDSDVMDEVLRTIDEGVGPQRRRPNLTFVNFPQVDAAGHGFGTDTGAYATAIELADTEVRRFVEHQKRLGLWSRTVLFVVSDHSMDSTPQKTNLDLAFRQAGIPTSSYLVQGNGSLDMVYLRDRGAADAPALLKRMRQVALAQSAVDEALYRLPNPADGGEAATLDAVHPGWRVAGERTGDLVVTHRPNGAFTDSNNPLVGNHGGPQTTDNIFFVTAGGGQVRQQALDGERGPRFDDTLLNPQQAQNVDVAPTVLSLLGLPIPATNEGRVLAEAFTAQAPGNVPASAVPGCSPVTGMRDVAVRVRRRRIELRAGRTSAARGVVRADLFRQSAGRDVLGNRRVDRAAVRRGRARLHVRGDGYYVLRLRVKLRTGRTEVRRIALRRRGGRLTVLPRYDRTRPCALLKAAKLERPVFGGRRPRALGISFRLRESARVTVTVKRGRRLVRRFAVRTRRPGLHRLRLAAEPRRRADHLVRIEAVGGGGRDVVTLTARRL